MSIVKSFKYALEGFPVLASERNFRIHLCIALLVVAAGYCLDISRSEWISILLCIALVLMAEGFNTVIEIICDRISTNQDIKIKIIKDVSAASVLIMALGSAVVGLIIFIPKII